VLVKQPPKGMGSDQRKHWEALVACKKSAKTPAKFTAGYVAEHAALGRRTLRRGIRAGCLVGWGPNAK
jgi:hypothetical protein